MSDAIKAGDLVMVVKPMPCCGADRFVGLPFRVHKTHFMIGYCGYCGYKFTEQYWQAQLLQNGGCASFDRLKKIDPPETGDSLPTRADLDIPEPDCP